MKRSDGSKTVKNTNFRTARMDRPDRRFAAAHGENDEERSNFIPGKKVGKMRYRDEGRRRDDKRSFKKPFRRGGKNDFGD